MTGESEDMTAKERLLLWSKQITEGYVGVRCDNFTTSWRDGRLFNAIIHKYRYCNIFAEQQIRFMMHLLGLVYLFFYWYALL